MLILLITLHVVSCLDVPPRENGCRNLMPILLRLDVQSWAATVTQQYFRGFTVRCLRFGVDQLQVSFSICLRIDCDADSDYQTGDRFSI